MQKNVDLQKHAKTVDLQSLAKTVDVQSLAKTVDMQSLAKSYCSVKARGHGFFKILLLENSQNGYNSVEKKQEEFRILLCTF